MKKVFVIAMIFVMLVSIVACKKTSVEETESEAEELIEEALEAQEDGKLDKAIRKAKLAIEADPENVDAYETWIDIYTEMDDETSDKYFDDLDGVLKEAERELDEKDFLEVQDAYNRGALGEADDDSKDSEDEKDDIDTDIKDVTIDHEEDEESEDEEDEEDLEMDMESAEIAIELDNTNKDGYIDWFDAFFKSDPDELDDSYFLMMGDLMLLAEEKLSPEDLEDVKDFFEEKLNEESEESEESEENAGQDDDTDGDSDSNDMEYIDLDDILEDEPAVIYLDEEGNVIDPEEVEEEEGTGDPPTIIWDIDTYNDEIDVYMGQGEYYKAMLTAEEIMEHYESDLDGYEAWLEAYFKFDEEDFDMADVDALIIKAMSNLSPEDYIKFMETLNRLKAERAQKIKDDLAASAAAHLLGGDYDKALENATALLALDSEQMSAYILWFDAYINNEGEDIDWETIDEMMWQAFANLSISDHDALKEILQKLIDDILGDILARLIEEILDELANDRPTSALDKADTFIGLNGYDLEGYEYWLKAFIQKYSIFYEQFMLDNFLREAELNLSEEDYAKLLEYLKMLEEQAYDEYLDLLREMIINDIGNGYYGNAMEGASELMGMDSDSLDGYRYWLEAYIGEHGTSYDQLMIDWLMAQAKAGLSETDFVELEEYLLELIQSIGMAPTVELLNEVYAALEEHLYYDAQIGAELLMELEPTWVEGYLIWLQSYISLYGMEYDQLIIDNVLANAEINLSATDYEAVLQVWYNLIEQL